MRVANVTAIKVSAVMIARDAEATLVDCLSALERFDEVIVYENGSTDRTAEIASMFPNVILKIGTFEGFGPTKNKAAACASNDWVLSIDTDEIASPELVDSIAGLDLSDDKQLSEVHRQNYLMGKYVRHGGWENDWLPRLYNHQVHGYNDAMVHENVIPEPDARVTRIKGPLRHEAVTDLSQFLVKIERYTEYRKLAGAKGYGPVVTSLKTFWAFFRSYFLKLGLLEGWRGVVIAYCDAAGVFFRCMKCYVRDLEEADTSDKS
jgi:glycosyltransferase involved in cell wall biosynthesis